jgi:choline dehydrogenase-like flavoprotein
VTEQPKETEALIIGAGLSGAVMATALARAGVKVTCLEQGARWNAEDYRGRHEDWELASFGPWHGSPNIRRGVDDYLIDDDDSEMKPMLFNGVGGSTILYGAHWMRFLPSDFRVRSLDGVADDWPISYAELAPWYDEADRQFGASGLAGDPAYPDRPDYPLPPLPVGKGGQKVAAAHSRLGWHWWPGTNAIASRPYEGRRPCVQRSTCGTGCNEGAKASVDVTHWPKAEAAGARILTKARVIEICVDSADRANGAVFIDGAGVRQRIISDIVILAANAIGSARLLLASRSGRHPDGLANRSGLVGKRLMLHPFTRVVGFFEEPLDSWQGHWGQSLYSMQFAETESSRGFVRGAKWNLTPTGGPLTAATFPWPGERNWGAAIHHHVRRWLGRSLIWGLSCEDLPEEENRVVLGESRGDDLPAPKLHYRVADNAHAMLAFNAARAAESFEAAGGVSTVAPPLMPEFGWHVLGTCRMGDDPEGAVVDRWGRSHDHRRLFMADSSVFVTGSSVNPAATVAALSLRTADHILKTRAIGDPA